MIAPPPLRLDRVTLRHGRTQAVEALSGSFLPGSLTAVVGANGAGKTTLLRGLAGLHAPAGGTIDRGGLAPSDMAMLPQGGRLDRDFPIELGEFVALAATTRCGPFRRIAPAQRAAAADALAVVGLADHAGRPIATLSAGQMQRALFARLIVQDAPVLLLDEPFTAIDAATEEDLLGLLQRWHTEGRTVIVVLHDLDLVRVGFPDCLLLAGALIAWGPTEAVLSEANRRRAGLTRRPTLRAAA